MRISHRENLDTRTYLLAFNLMRSLHFTSLVLDA